jgi:hypothetical protein
MFHISNDPVTMEIRRKYPLISEFFDQCHGSGIDGEWQAEEDAKNIYLYNFYHVMNSCGMYVSYEDFTVTIPKADIMDFKITFANKCRYWVNHIKDYLNEEVGISLHDIAEKLTANGFAPIKNGIIERRRFEVFEAKEV